MSLKNTDISAVRNEYLFKPPNFINHWILKQIRDKRDAPIAYLMFNITIIVVPGAMSLFLSSSPTHLCGLIYLGVCFALFLQRFILCLHYVEHLQPFKGNIAGSILAQLCPNIFCVLFGIPPGVYRLHHIMMHHCENNLFPWDVSSTEPYQRDSFLQFLGYWIRFWAAISVELPWYAVRRKRYGLAIQSAFTIIAYLTIGYFLYQSHPVATLWVLILPYFLTSFAMMFGNWSQHMFIDPIRPRNNYSLTYNVINCADNQRSFNDGYHIVHHVNSKVHWMQLPTKFMETIKTHAEEDAIIFEGIGFFDVGVLAFSGQLGALADRYVNIGQKQRTRDEVIKLLRSRLKPINIESNEKND